MRKNKTLDVTKKQVDSAKRAAFRISSVSFDIDSLYDDSSLDSAEKTIRRLSEFSSSNWLVSSMVLYAVIYNGKMYKQSGLDWDEYLKQGRARLGLEERDVTEMLSAARFYIMYHDMLDSYGWSPVANQRKLARAELALSLCGDPELTVKHLATDTWTEFKDWYQSYKAKKNVGVEYKASNGRFFVDGTEALVFAENLPAKQRKLLSSYMNKIFRVLKSGDEVEISSKSGKKKN